MDRTTKSHLEYLVKRINEATNSPLDYCDKTSGIPFKSYIGHYHLDYAYGGVKLVRTTNESDGITEISRDGFGTKRQLYSWMQAFLAGLTS